MELKRCVGAMGSFGAGAIAAEPASEAGGGGPAVARRAGGVGEEGAEEGALAIVGVVDPWHGAPLLEREICDDRQARALRCARRRPGGISYGVAARGRVGRKTRPGGVICADGAQRAQVRFVTKLARRQWQDIDEKGVPGGSVMGLTFPTNDGRGHVPPLSA